jgi:hypothetical protein
MTITLKVLVPILLGIFFVAIGGTAFLYLGIPILYRVALWREPVQETLITV